MRMCKGTLLRMGTIELTAKTAAYRVKVVGVNTDDPIASKVKLSPPLPTDPAVIERTIHFINDVPLDTTFDIRAISGDYLSTGDSTVVWGFKDPQNFASGYKYLVNVGDDYVVPGCAALDP